MLSGLAEEMRPCYNLMFIKIPLLKEHFMAALTDTALCYQTIEDLKGRMQALKERL